MARRQIALAFPITAGHHTEIVQGIVEYAQNRGLRILFTAPETYDLSVQCLKGWPGNGVIADVVTRRQATAARELGIPVVNLSGALADADLPRVMNNQHAIGRLAAEHLLAREIRRFAYYGLKRVWYARQRGQGFVERLREAGFPCAVMETASTLGKNQTWLRWLQELCGWLKKMKPPFGIMAADDNRARMIVDACQQAGLFVPHDVAVIGVDNDQLACEISRPTISSVARNGREIGYHAARLLEHLMSGRRPPKNDVLIPPAGIVARESTDMVAIDDPDLSSAVRFIHDHISQPFFVEDLLRDVSVSRRWLEYRFRERFGHSPHEYICEARVERAKQLLLGADNPSMQQVVQRCGFRDVRNFRLVFRRFTGMAPREFRWMYQVGPHRPSR